MKFFGICSRVGSFLRCRRRAQTSTRSSLSSSEAQSNKVPILARSKPISKHGGGGAKKSQLPSLAIQKKKPTGSRKKTKVVKESQIGECAVEKQDSVEQMQMKMAKLMKQFNDLKMSQQRARSVSKNPEEDDSELLLDQQQMSATLQSIDTKCKVIGSTGDEEKEPEDDGIMQLLSKENFGDVADYVLEEAVLEQEYPEANAERIKLERDLQAAHYVLQKFLAFEKQRREAVASSDAEFADSEGIGMDMEFKMAEDSFYQFICPICLKLMQKSVTTLCGHSYCDSCLSNYLIFKETCFVCDFFGTKRVELRDKPLQVSFKVDDIINQLVENCKNKQIKADWQERQAEHAQKQKERQVGELEIDMLVDVRDMDYIWCEGKVNMIIEQINKDALYVIHYEGKPSSEDEIILGSSVRLAKHGSYTSRFEIPSWQSSKNEDGQKVLILRNQILGVYHLLMAQKNTEILVETEVSGDKEMAEKSPSDEMVPGDIQVPPTVGQDEQQADQIESQINSFLSSFEESNIDRARLLRWASQQSQQNRPIYLRNVIDSFQQAQSNSRQGSSLIDSLTRHLRGSTSAVSSYGGDGQQHHHGGRHVGRHSHSGERGGSSRDSLLQAAVAGGAGSSSISSLIENIFRIENMTNVLEAAAHGGASSGQVAHARHERSAATASASAPGEVAQGSSPSQPHSGRPAYHDVPLNIDAPSFVRRSYSRRRAPSTSQVFVIQSPLHGSQSGTGGNRDSTNTRR